MARRLVVHLVDDIDGERAVETVSFGLDGTLYEIDLSVNNSVQLRTAFQGYIAQARKTAPVRHLPRRRALAPRIAADPMQADVRRWAKNNGWRIGERGRVPADVLAAYNAAHPR